MIAGQSQSHHGADRGLAFQGYNPIGDPSLITTGYPDLMQKVWALVAKPGLSAAICRKRG